jgi:hypothetical protein
VSDGTVFIRLKLKNNFLFKIASKEICDTNTQDELESREIEHTTHIETDESSAGNTKQANDIPASKYLGLNKIFLGPKPNEIKSNISVSMEFKPTDTIQTTSIDESNKTRILKGSMNINEFLNTFSPTTKSLQRSEHNMNKETSKSYKSLNNLNRIDKMKILDKCLKIASYNVSAVNLNQTSLSSSTLKNPSKSNETGSLKAKLIDKQLINEAIINGLRIPSSRNFCGRLISKDFMRTNTSQDADQPPIVIKRHTTLPNKQHQHQIVNENKFDDDLNTANSIKDLKCFVSNSFSPSLIIKPPSPKPRQHTPIIKKSHYPSTQTHENSFESPKNTRANLMKFLTREQEKKFLIENNHVLNSNYRLNANSHMGQANANRNDNNENDCNSCHKSAPLAHNDEFVFFDEQLSRKRPSDQNQKLMPSHSFNTSGYFFFKVSNGNRALKNFSSDYKR